MPMVTEPALRLMRFLGYFSRAAAVFALLVATLALVGWAFKIVYLVTIGDAFATLKANTAVCFILSACALWLLHPEPTSNKSRRLATKLLAWLVIMPALTTLSQDLFGWNTGIDELIVRDTFGMNPVLPGRMSPASAVNFVLIGGASVLLESRMKHGVAAAQILATLVVLASVLVLLGYLFNVRELYSLPPFSGEALRTALTFLVLGLALLAVRADRGWIAEFVVPTPSAKMGRSLLMITFIVLPALDWFLQQGEDIGWYGRHFGLAATIVVDTAVLGGFIWFTTRAANSANKKILRLSRVYEVISGINSVIIRAQNRKELFDEACRITVVAGGFPLVWIGTVDHETKQVMPQAWNGAIEGVPDPIPLGLSLPRHAGVRYGPVARAVHERKAVTTNNVARDASFLQEPWYAKYGIQSIAILPLVVEDKVDGVIALYADVPDVFDDDEMRLLLELGADVAFGLDHLTKQEKLDYLAYYDTLTHLANAHLFRERLALHIAATDGYRQPFAVLVLDVERFKIVNETLGRHVGDSLLRQIADRLAQHVGDANRLARLGPDQFAVVVHDVKTEDNLARRHERMLHESFGQPFEVDGAVLRISARAGIALYPNDGTDADTLIENAETALKRAKTSGERYLFYTQQMTERSAERLDLETKLRQALERDEFVLYYQPKLDLRNGAVTGVEALIRWRSPELGLVPPARFVPLLEETGLISEVGKWALRQAAADHREWSDAGIVAPRVAVNVSAIQLRRPDFVTALERAISAGANPPQIDIEITETLIMENIEQNIERLLAIHALGVEIAIDDFGTGYSSLAYLAKLPVQFIKIDRSFVTTMLNEANTLTLVSTIISMAHSLKLKVVAEGVDSYQQRDILRQLRCDQLQGFIVTEPIPPTAMHDFLRHDSPRVKIL